MIRFENVVKVYGDKDSSLIALNNISLNIPKGKFVSIIGKSGSGKTTLLNLIGGLDKATSGKISVGENNLADFSNDQLSEYRNKNIGFVFQSFYLESSFTVLENVEIPLVIAGVDKKTRREKAVELITRLDLMDKLNKKASTLSGGQKQRVSIARALINSPDIILADEPTGNLDSKNGAEVMKILHQINLEGKTVILITHNLEDAMKADYIIEIHDGQISNIIDRSIEKDEVK